MARRTTTERARGTAAAPMLLRFGYLQACTLGATDGDIGSVHDLRFDDRSWTVRYLVVDTGTWLPGRRVLVSPMSLEGFDSSGQRLMTGLTKAQVEGAPGVDTERPVSRQKEIELSRYWGYPYYWEGPYRWGPGESPGLLTADRIAAGPAAAEEPRDGHLQSTRAVSGYGIRASDGDLGHVEDYLVEDEPWAIRYLIVDPRNWWPDKHVLVSVEWITHVSWSDSVVSVNMSRQAVRDAPQYDASAAVSRDYETRLHSHYGRPGYWDRRPEAWKIWPAA